MNGTAAIFVGNEKPFELREYPVTKPEPGAILVRVLLANICGSDLHMRRAELDLERLKLPMPLCLGHEAVGEVEALGAGVSVDTAGEPLRPGDRVTWRYFSPCGRCRACLSDRTRACQASHRFISQGQSADQAPHFVGVFATHYYLPPGQVVFKTPAHLSDAMVAGANCALAEVVQGLAAVGLHMGETVVTQGAGGLGLYACAIAKHLGAGKVIAIDSVASRLELAQAFGADEVINLEQITDPKDRVKSVRELTAGSGADVVCEFVGHASVMREGIQMLAPGGRYLEVGCISTGTSFELDPAHLTLLNRSIVAVSYYEPWALRTAIEFLGRAADDHPWDRLVPQRYPLPKINDAFQDAIARRVPRAAIQPLLPL